MVSRQTVDVKLLNAVQHLAVRSRKILGHRYQFVFADIITRRGELAAPLRTLGESLGRYIYLCDAVKDWKSDMRSGCFNALVATGHSDPDDGAIRAYLNHQLLEISEALASLPLGRSLSIMKALASSLHRRSERLLGQLSFDRRRIGKLGLASNSGEIRWGID